jgi:murein DD-endopeptidase
LKYHRNKTCLNFNESKQKNATHHVIQYSYNTNNQNYINFTRCTKKYIYDVLYNFENSSITKKKDDQFFDTQQYLNRTFLKKKILIKKNSNFFKTAYQFGLNPCDIKNIIDAMSGKINWKKLHVGSSLSLIFLNDINKQNNVKDEKTKNLLLGIKLNNAKKTYYAIHALNGYFYDENGLNRETIFVNYDFLKKYRISSPFNLHRLHPITHKITRHLGIDVAMPQGTPVLAANNGKIVKSSFDNISGWHITLKSKHKYMTRYMHLKKILVKLGDIVKIGQKIALSGNTGRTTGPHLHYEVWIDNHAVNPENSRFTFSNKLTEKEKITYLNHAKKILQLLK